MWVHDEDKADQLAGQDELAGMSDALGKLNAAVGDNANVDVNGLSHATLAARVAVLEAQYSVFGTLGFRELRSFPNVSAPNSKVDVTAARLAVGGVVLSDVAVTIDLTVAGKNGLDTGSEAVNTTYYEWILQHPQTGEVAGVFSTSPTVPTLTHASLAGFTRYKLTGSAHNNGSSNLVEAWQEGAFVSLAGAQHLVKDGASAPGGTGFQTASLRPPSGTVYGGLPSIAREALLVVMLSTATASRGVRIRPTGATGTGTVPIFNKPSAPVDWRATVLVATNGTQQVDWLQIDGSSNGVNEAGVYLYVAGYWLPIA